VRSSSQPAIDAAQRVRASNRRVAWTLASIAAVFFAGIIATRWLGGGTIGIGVMGTVVLLFLVVAIGRNLRSTDERSDGVAEAKRAAEREPAQTGAGGAAAPGTANGARR